MVNVAADRVVVLFLCLQAEDEGLGGILGENLAGEVADFSVLVGHGLHGKEHVIRRRAPGAGGELVLLGKLRGRRTGEPEGLARHGVGEGVSGAPLLVVVARSA